MTSNCNAITEYAEENQTVDETTWGHSGYGEAGNGITTRLMNTKVNKGGQTSLITDSRRYRPRAYIHHHKLHKQGEEQTSSPISSLTLPTWLSLPSQLLVLPPAQSGRPRPDYTQRRSFGSSRRSVPTTSSLTIKSWTELVRKASVQLAHAPEIACLEELKRSTSMLRSIRLVARNLA